MRGGRERADSQIVQVNYRAISAAFNFTHTYRHARAHTILPGPHERLRCNENPCSWAVSHDTPGNVQNWAWEVHCKILLQEFEVIF